jgi:hypothetical protein
MVRQGTVSSPAVSGVIMEAETMPDTIFTAPEYDAARERKKKIIAIVIVGVVVVGAFAAWWFRYWPQERIVDRFFDSIQAKDYKTAYGIWNHDPQWEQHLQNFTQYPFNDFYRDWGPGGDFGLVKEHHVDCAAGGGNGVVVVVTVNGRVEKAKVWVLKKDKTLGFAPFEVQCR